MAGPLLVFDAPSLLYRAFYALPDSITEPDGKRPVNALLGTTNLVLRASRRTRRAPSSLCFGADAAPYRVELYADYHADRPEMPDELAWQWSQARGFYEAFGWTVAHDDAVEADDLLGSLAHAEREAGGEALILTGDRDMYQCAAEGVHVLYVKTGQGAAPRRSTPPRSSSATASPPALVPDFIALRGDPSDGLPGAKGVGEKTAAELLRAYGSLEGADRRRAEGHRADPPAGGQLAARPGATSCARSVRSRCCARCPSSARRTRRWTARRRPAAARKLGMNRLAERLENLATRDR